MQTQIPIESIPELKRLFEALGPGDELVVTFKNQTIGKYIESEAPAKKKLRPPPGLGKAMIEYVAPDFDAPLECMKEYME